MKKLLVLGSTGSIGVNTLNVVRRFRDRFEIEGLTVNSNIRLLEEQMREFHPSFVVVRDERAAAELKQKNITGCKILCGESGLVEAAATGEYDILLSAMVGFAGLAPTIEGIKRGKRIALANKETLVVAGELVTKLCREHNSELLPVDSEHSAIFQCLEGEGHNEVGRLILTASGGPFLNKSRQELESVTVEEALNHPNWKMGKKITIDSATMMNKGLEVIEAAWLFNVPREKIQVVIHPQSIIHSMVEFVDGSIKAQMGLPDMKLPIQYALTYPGRLAADEKKTHLPGIKYLTFFEPDTDKFECLKIAYNVMEAGGTAPCIMNAANEVAVARFLEGGIRFMEIPELIMNCLSRIDNHRSPDLQTIFECDRETRELAKIL
ncbi:MAG: 1-deoxy-D-xylulose-5-phosphate reductoisomerase [Bacteroidota bacterium]